MAVVTGNTALKLRVMVGMMMTKRALAKGVVLNENPVTNFKIQES